MTPVITSIAVSTESYLNTGSSLFTKDRILTVLIKSWLLECLGLMLKIFSKGGGINFSSQPQPKFAENVVKIALKVDF